MSEQRRSSAKAGVLALVGEDNKSLREDRDAWRKNTRFWQAVACALVVVCGVLSTRFFEPEVAVVAQVTDGQNSWVVPLTKLDRPHVPVASVTTFASEAAAVALSFSFARWETELGGLDNYFLPDAAAQLKQALTATRYFQRLEETSSVTTAVPKSAPVVTGEQRNPVVKWKLKFPMVVTWRGPTTRTEEVSVEMIVRQVQPYIHPRGVMVERVNIL